mmetsp:Transcript_50392/g.116320  ORF Transcript_50392/g.116320 Transcript_50392/m.116320 type:complete len:450 (-) Transcript_50392:427-1776(-)
MASVGVAAFVALCLALCASPLGDGLTYLSLTPSMRLICVNALLSIGGYFLTRRMAMSMRETFIKARLFGIDLNKPETKRDERGALVRPVEGPIVPEAMGAVAGTAFLVCMFVFIPFAFVSGGSRWGSSERAMTLSKFLCALLAICCMCFLGFADNVLDLRWRDKLWLPLTASLPLLMVYAVDGGGTVVMAPKPLDALIGGTIDIGVLYYVFMASLAIFCTNSINILAGVNGLEAGQSVVIALTVIANNLIQLWRWPEGPLHDNNLFSLCLMLPFVAVSSALLQLNWHPAQIFVGDTYCYFAGMSFAVVGILGHNAKTVLLFFIPQVINFIYSVPQLFKWIPCPRHRMPAYDRQSDKLVVSYSEFDATQLSAAGKLIVFLFSALRLARVERDGSRVRMSNLTVINFALHCLGPMHEPKLTLVLLLVQTACSAVALLVRYQLAGLFYDVVR